MLDKDFITINFKLVIMSNHIKIKKISMIYSITVLAITTRTYSKHSPMIILTWSHKSRPLMYQSIIWLCRCMPIYIYIIIAMAVLQILLEWNVDHHRIEALHFQNTSVRTSQCFLNHRQRFEITLTTEIHAPNYCMLIRILTIHRIILT